ncbi:MULTISPECIES: hypothetical protein [unclassified Methylomonas]|uniref:hypothetical protein n=1 Tax=unclassified Methylomonas TaxID=2608980 RepID=UPI0010553086|nr:MULTISPECIES: hypothetical protein [unclassified Methylomonas]
MTIWLGCTLRRSWQSDWVKLGLIGFLILIVYFPGRMGPFIADDYPNILQNKGVLLTHLNFSELMSTWSSNASGVFKRPLANVSFALNYYFAGQYFDPIAFKLTNIAIHVVNSVLVFFLSRLLFSATAQNYPAQKLALMSALIWGLHPLQLTSVLYVVQRMNSLSCFFMLTGFLIFLKGRLQLEKPFSILLMLVGSLFGSGLGILAKENALLLPLLIVVSEILLPSIPNDTSRVRVQVFYAITVVLPVFVAIIYLFSHPEYVLGGYATRNFTLAERVMTQTRVLFYYLSLLFYPDNTQLSFDHDDFSLSKSLFQPISTFYSVIGILCLLVLSVFNCVRKKTPFFNFGILWFLVGQSMESSIFALELIYEHRNYVPSIGLVIATVALTYNIFSKLISEQLLNILFAVVVFSLGLATFSRASIWSSLDALSYFEVRNHPTSIRANSLYAHSLEVKLGPNPESYRYYLLAAQGNELEVATLVQVYMELNKLLYFQDAKNDQPGIAMPKRYDDPLILDSHYMQALKSLVHQEVLARIANKAYSVRTLVTLRLMTSCLLNAEYQCKNISEDVMEWTDAALAQPDFSDRLVLYIIKAKICFFQGHIEEAFANVDKAIAQSPDRMYFYIEKADLLIHLKEYDTAEQVIKMAEGRGVANGFDKQEFSTLRQNIAVLSR